MGEPLRNPLGRSHFKHVSCRGDVVWKNRECRPVYLMIGKNDCSSTPLLLGSLWTIDASGAHTLLTQIEFQPPELEYFVYLLLDRKISFLEILSGGIPLWNQIGAFITTRATLVFSSYGTSFLDLALGEPASIKTEVMFPPSSFTDDTVLGRNYIDPWPEVFDFA